MPVAYGLPDAALLSTLHHFRNNTRATLTFQVLPRLTASFRYAALDGLGGVRDVLFDRSFDVHYQLWKEGSVRPSIAIGLRDFVGTGVYSSEYLVATKTLGKKFALTAGLGWGRLGTEGGVRNPLGRLHPRFAARPPSASTRLGGQVESAQWFRGDMAMFAGFSWQASPRLRLLAEMSSDAYVEEGNAGLIAQRLAFNFGADFKLRANVLGQIYVLHGDTVGFGLSYFTDPKTSVAPSGTHPAPFPVRVRSRPLGQDLDWVHSVEQRTVIHALLGRAMANEGLSVSGFLLDARSARIDIENGRYGAVSEAVGRTARVLTQILPDTVETFQIVLIDQGVPMSLITLQRRDLEAFEHHVNGAEEILARSEFSAPPLQRSQTFGTGLYPRFSWGLAPYARLSLFDPDNPIRTDFGLFLSAYWEPAPQLLVSGAVRHRVAGTIGDDVRPSNSVIPRVRSESGQFAQAGVTALETLTARYAFRASKTLYGRVTVGYLEPQFGGISGEILWKPVRSRFALGLEVNAVKQRTFDQGFGFQSYSIVTGHVSSYWELGNHFHAQIDVGRYLAGDWGATLALDRTLNNGWRIGAYATLTDVPFEEFGEGSFDKGLRFVIPLEPLLGRPSRQQFSTILQPLSRDGGARLHVDGRLYDTVRNYHAGTLKSSWGRFWR